MSNTKVLPAGTRCLVLDDEFLIALDLQDILQAAGAAAVSCFSTADEALSALGGGAAFDLAVLDVKLGTDATSLPVAEALSAQRTPFVFLTGTRRDGGQTSAFPNAPRVEKPYQQNALIDAVQAALAAK